MRALFDTVLVLSLALTTLAPTVSAKQPNSPPPPAYQVIVHPKNPLTSVGRKFLEDAFLKKTTRWAHDKVIRPADLTPKSPVRRRFSKEVLDRSIAAVKAYWQQRIFSGHDVPPPELDTDEQVVAFVLKHDGAVGYVSGTANLRAAKALTVSK